ncbi:tetratricopeptide repeat protein [Thermogutta sp.]|uniref:tetratricopeptide repeat protein n=1 Tax=Thermogutta sp. TaxID=1962930 RepID=UPI0032201FE6
MRLASRKPSDWCNPEELPKADVVPEQQSARRSFWVRKRFWAACAALLLIGVLFRLVWDWTHPPSPLLQVAADAAPEVAELLREADQLAQDTVAIFPDDPYAWDVMGQLLGRFGKTEDATQCWEKALQLDPNFAVGYQSLGNLALERGELKKAAEYYRKAWELQRDSSVFPVQLAEVLIQDGQLEEARQVLTECLRRHPRSLPARALLGQILVPLKDYSAACEHLMYVITANPDYTNAYYPLSTALSRLGHTEESRKYLARFQEMKRRDEQRHRTTLKTETQLPAVRAALARAYLLVAKIYIARGDIATGERLLKRGLELNPDEEEIPPLLGWLYFKTGRENEAASLLHDYRQKHRDSLEAQMATGKVFAEFKRFDEAEAAYRRAIELTPLEAGGYAALASLYLTAGKRPFDAHVLALRAAAREPAPQFFFILAIAAQRDGDSQAALSAAQEAARLDPTNDQYQRLLDSLRRTL